MVRRPMSRELRLAAVAVLCILCVPVHASMLDEPVGPYLGETLPGSTPRMFARGIISVSADFEHSAAVFSPDGCEVFWCTNVNARTNPPGEGQRLYVMRQVDGVWTPPEIAPFTETIGGTVQRPVFSPEGDRLYFEVFGDSATSDHSDIYMVERVENGWSAPTPLPASINTGDIERVHCVTSDGSLIFSRAPFTIREVVYISRLVDGVFTEPERLGDPFDSEAHELAIVMAADESYVLIGATRSGLEDLLYISYRNPDGSWTDRIRASYQCGGFLALSPDEEYLFFLGEGIYWVDTSFVDALRPATTTDTES